MSKNINAKDVLVPAGVPKSKKLDFVRNFLKLTHKTGNLMMFAGDQRIEHLNYDFYGSGIDPDDADPEHFFRIANKAKIGALATHYGLISRYAPSYKNVPYIVKLNAKTNLVKTAQKDPFSDLNATVEEVVKLKNDNRLNILGVGYTLYPGSEFESQGMWQAAYTIKAAHANGLIAILWIYPRGKAVKDERDPQIIASAAGIGCCLGADFVKINYPQKSGKKSKELFKRAVTAAGNTGVIVSGGSSKDPKKFLEELHDQIEAGARGNATARNIHQKSLKDAVKMANAIYAITIEGKTVAQALKIYHGK